MIRNPKVEVPAGDDCQLFFEAREQDGSPMALAGGRARWWMAPSAATRGTSIVKKDSEGGLVTLLVEDDLYVIAVTIEPEDTKDLPPRGYYHEVYVTDADGKGSTIYGGRFTVLPTLIASQV